MHTKTIERGQLCNQIIRNLSVSIIAKKNNLYVEYSQYDKINSLGIKLYVGNKFYPSIIELNDENYFDILNLHSLKCGLNPNNSYFQTKSITNFLYKYLNSDEIKNNIINKNPFKDRYNNNNDCVVHIRLTDAAQYSPKYEYFIKLIEQITYDNLYIASDDINHDIIKEISTEKSANIINLNDIETIQFSSTCKNIILSHGTYSAMIGYLGFYSNVYYTELKKENLWHGDIFSIDSENWIKI